ncbi:hypothetical protein I317_04475 [Kwoniella heveanensis CBS 569]|nr:hypothetical protein I317_04475 [Kwoniella heveanensis CBS 569]
MLGIARNRLTPFNDVELLVFGNLVKNRPPNSVLTFVNARSINPSILRQTLATTTSARNRSRRSVFTLGTEILHDGVEAEDAFRRAIKERIIRKTLSDHDRRGRSAALSDEERMKMQKEKDAELDQIEEAFERVRWLDMETWLKEDGWAGVLTYKEARRWLADDWLRA